MASSMEYATSRPSTAYCKQRASLLCLANNTAAAGLFAEAAGRFNKLFQRKVFIHHYLQYMEEAGFQEALDSNVGLRGLYKEAEKEGQFRLSKYSLVV